MNVITRFAPSPTGSLHIGGARTALFNYLYAKNKAGKFLLRIEDTDKVRSTSENTQIIYDSLKWLQIDWDNEIVIQSEREERHRKIAHQLLKEEKAYYCYYSKEELEFIRQNRQEKDFFYNKWRDKHEAPPKDIEPVIRIKSPQNGTMIINDVIQGKIEVDCAEIDDFVILRSDGTPTYMLAAVVDDHDMGITHIIRGADHLTNAGRQNVIYEALNWKIPSYTHIPLIHAENGAKLSKRHGALGVEAYKNMGYLPEAICNYLLRLGWSHGNDEVISKQEAIEWFDIRDIGKSAARIDFKKLDYLNAHYIKIKPTNELLKSLKPFISNINPKISKEDLKIFEKGLDLLKIRVKTLKEMAEKGMFFLVDAEKLLTEDSIKLLNNDNQELLNFFVKNFENHMDWNKESIMEKVKEIAGIHSIKLNELMQILRIALTGSVTSPSIVEIMEIFGKNLTLKKLKNFSEKIFKLYNSSKSDKLNSEH